MEYDKAQYLDLYYSQFTIPQMAKSLKKHYINYHFDGQMYLAFSPKNKLSRTEARTKMKECAKEVK